MLIIGMEVFQGEKRRSILYDQEIPPFGRDDKYRVPEWNNPLEKTKQIPVPL